MELGLKVLVLLAFAFNLVHCDLYDCPANSYQNDKSLITEMSGWLYTIYTSKVFGNNEVFNCDVSKSGRNVYCLTTNDNQCCRSFNISTIVKKSRFDKSAEYFPYLIETSSDCPQQLYETANMKLLNVNYDRRDRSTCLTLWTCRPSREGFHAFCSKQAVSRAQDTWIRNQFRQNNIVPQKVTQVEDYRKGKCFPKSVETGRDNLWKKDA